MNETIDRLEARDHGELIAFLDKAFGQPADFPFDKLLPAIYQPDDASMSANFAVRKGGSIVAVIGLFPITWHIGGRKIDAAVVGGVSVAEAFRRQGLMTTMMRHVVDEISRERYQVVLLGGQRQRYLHHGWEKAGICLSYEVTPASLRHTAGSGRLDSVKLVPLSDGSEWTPVLKVMNESRPTWCERSTRKFPLHLRNWGNTPYIAMDQQERPVGYAVLGRDKRLVPELAAVTGAAAVQIIRSLMEIAGTNCLSVETDILDVRLIRILEQICESVRPRESGNWRIFDWPNVVETLLLARLGTGAVCEGTVVVGLDDRHIALSISVDSDGPHCEITDTEPDIHGTEAQMVRLLFGPCKPSARSTLPSSAAVLDSWCPLPLALPIQDHG